MLLVDGNLYGNLLVCRLAGQIFGTCGWQRPRGMPQYTFNDKHNDFKRQDLVSLRPLPLGFRKVLQNVAKGTKS